MAPKQKTETMIGSESVSGFATTAAFHVARGDIERSTVELMLGRVVEENEPPLDLALMISDRITRGELPLARAKLLLKLGISGMEARRNCQERPGSAQLLEILEKTCPQGVDREKKRAAILRVLDVYQGPCCQQSPCVYTKSSPTISPPA